MLILLIIFLVLANVYWYDPNQRLSSPVRNLNPETPPRVTENLPFRSTHINGGSTSRNRAESHFMSSPSSASSNAGNVILPDFWPASVEGYFKTIDLLFVDSGTDTEAAKYASFIIALSRNKSHLAKVANILQHLDNDTPYARLKGALLKRFSEDENSSLFHLIQHCKKDSNESFSEYLIR